MLSENIVTALYIAASVLFILSLGGLSGQESAKRAVWYGIVGMALAVLGTIFGPSVLVTTSLLPLLVVGAVIGGVVAMQRRNDGHAATGCCLAFTLSGWRQFLSGLIPILRRHPD